MAFVHLRAHSCHSLFDGAMTAKTYAAALKATHFDTGALTDSANLCGTVEWTKACAEKGVRPIFGALLWMRGEPPVSSHPSPEEPDTSASLLLYVQSTQGWENLCALLSLGTHHIHYRPQVPIEAVLAHATGLTALVPFDAGVPWRWAPEAAEQALEALAQAFPEGRLGMEVFDHGLGWEEARRAEAKIMAQALSIPLVGTNACRYVTSTDAPTLDALRAIARKVPVHALGAWAGRSDQAFVADEVEMRARLGGGPCDAAAAFAQALTWAPPRPTWQFPRSEPPVELSTDEARWTWLFRWYPPPAPFQVVGVPSLPERAEGEALLDAYFSWYARAGLEVRLAADPTLDGSAYRERLESEIVMIRQMGFPAYMLIVAEFINWAKDAGIPVGPGRGSVAGSMVAWAMRITEVDPIRFSLLFARFLNISRISMPDVDVDFGKARREEAIQHMKDRYGVSHVGQILNFGTFGPKSAFKDASRVLGIRFDEANRYSGWISEKADTLNEAVAGERRLLGRMQIDPLVRRVRHLAAALCNEPVIDGPVKKDKTAKADPLLRSRGVHAAGVVVTPRPLEVYAPVHFDAESGRQVLGTNMDGVDTLGLIKFDFLGLKTLDVIEETLDTVQARTGARPDMDRVALDDQSTLQMLSKGDVLAVFQIEGSGIGDLVRRLKPDSIDDIIAILALYRPGPLASGMVDDFVERKHGRAPIEDLHPRVRDILANTYGVMVYQEQIMQVAQALSGYSMPEADLLRRAIGKKKADEMAKQRSRWNDGCSKNGIDVKKATEIFDMIEKFADYCFNAAHSASYGLITYRTAWLKCHHRAAFMAAAASWESDDKEKLAVYVMDCRRAGLTVLPPDINQSLDRFTVVDDVTIRWGLRAVHGLGDAALHSILEARKVSPFVSLEDFSRRIDPRVVNTKILEALTAAGALDVFGQKRGEALTHLKTLREAGRKEAQRKKAAERAAERAAAKASGAPEPPPKPRKPRKPCAPKPPAVDQAPLFGSPPGPVRVETPASPAKPPEAPGSRLPAPDSPPWSSAETFDREARALGVWLSGHPLDRYSDLEPRIRTHTIAALAEARAHETVELVAVVGKVHEIKTKRGEKMTFLALSDRTSMTEVVVFPELAARTKDFHRPGACVFARGAPDRGGAEGKVILTDLQGLDAMRARMTKTVRMKLSAVDVSGGRLDALREILGRHPGVIPVRITPSLEVGLGHPAVSALHACKVVPDASLFAALEAFFGAVDRVRAVV